MKYLVLGIASSLLLSGCFGAQPGTPTRYYPIEVHIDVPKSTATVWTLGVRPVAAARPYRMPIAYQQDGDAIQFRSRDSWSELPADIVTRAILDGLRKTGRFSDVGDASDMARPDLILTGEVRKFHERRDLDRSSAELEIRFELRQARGANLVWAETLTESVAMDGGSISDLASAMAEGLGRIVNRAAAQMAEAEVPLP